MFENFSWRNVWESARKFTHTALRKYAMFVLRLSPSQNILQGMILYTLLGWLALSLPFMDNGQVGLLDNLFTAASAMSTAGRNSGNFAESYTFLGKLVILLLVQAGGIGYMTMSSFLYLSFSRRLRPRHKEVLNTEFALPRTVRLQDFLRTAIIFTFIAELIGAAFLYNYFHRHGYGAAEAVWYGIFHSVSAFCTAGITLFPDNLLSFADSKTINIVISVLSLAGAMGFIVVTDMFNWLVRRTKEISYTSKIIVVFTLGALLMATFFILITNPHLTVAQAAFQATSAMTTAGSTSLAIATAAITVTSRPVAASLTVSARWDGSAFPPITRSIISRDNRHASRLLAISTRVSISRNGISVSTYPTGTIPIRPSRGHTTGHRISRCSRPLTISLRTFTSRPPSRISSCLTARRPITGAVPIRNRPCLGGSAPRSVPGS